MVVLSGLDLGRPFQYSAHLFGLAVPKRKAEPLPSDDCWLLAAARRSFVESFLLLYLNDRDF